MPTRSELRIPSGKLLAAVLATPGLPDVAVRAAASLPDPWPRVAAAVAAPSAAPFLLGHHIPAVRAVALGRTDDPQLLIKAAQSSAVRTRAIVARNRHTPPDVLGELLEDADVAVRRAVLCNPSCPDQDATDTVRFRALSQMFAPDKGRGATGTSVVRMAGARAVLHANPHVAHLVNRDLDSAVRKAVISMPKVLAYLTPEQLGVPRSKSHLLTAQEVNPFVPDELLSDQRCQGRRAHLRTVLDGDRWQQSLDTDVWWQRVAAAFGSHTLDALLVEASQLDAGVPEVLLLRDAWEPDAFTIARLIERFGMGAYAHTYLTASTRMRAAQAHSPLLAALSMALPLNSRDIHAQTTGAAEAAPQLTALVGTEEHSWRTMLSVLHAQHTPLTVEDTLTSVAGILAT